MDIVKLLGERIIELRKKNNINREDLAKEFGIPYTTLRNYENGLREPGHLFLIKVAKRFNVSTDYLLGISNEINATKITIPKIDDNDTDKQKLLHNYEKLNDNGKDRLLEYSDDLVASGRYVKSNSQDNKMNA